jgi:hypothetical protein
MASEIAKRIDEVIKLGIAPLLKENGFSKKGRNFHKAAGEAIQVVNIQADKWNQGYTGQFTINLGVYFRAISEISERSIVDGLPKEYDCTIVNRLGFLMPTQDDKWWSLGDGVEDEQVASDVADALKECGLPWLQSASTRDGLRASFQADSLYFHFHPRFPIALEILDGNTEQAAILLRNRVEQAAGNQGFINQMTEWGRKHGLL